MFRGAYTALVTPFRGGRVDVEALERLVESQIAGGIHGLVPCGTTGESPTLTHAEQLEVIEIVIKTAAGRVPVLAGAGSNSTAEAIELSTACKALGATGTLQITPYYNKPTQSGLVAHFTRIAEASQLPIVLYNVPGRTCCDLLPETAAELAEHPLVVGIKEATASMERACALRELCGPDFDLLSGDDHTLLPFLSVGGNGVISVGSNIIPGVFAKLCEAARDGRWDEARELHLRQLPLTRALFTASSPIPLKTAMAKMGLIAPEIRLPLEMMAPGPELDQLETELRNLELLK